MKKNILLFLKSLFSNNAAIDGARKKPWYAAIIIFFISIVLSVIPGTVLQLNKHGDKNFDSTSYNTREATTQFAIRLQAEEFKDHMYVNKIDKKTSQLVSKEFSTVISTSGIDFVFAYVNKDNLSQTQTELDKGGVSYFLFSVDSLHIRVLNPNDHNSTAVEMECINAYKKVGKDDIKNSLASSADLTEMANNTWANWKSLIRKFYNQTRLKAAGMQLIIISSINVGISLIMGFMIWVLTRGKNNAYRLFNVWECFKISWWAGVTPALLSLGFGFLIKNFATMIFPLLLGVRVMWLSMKSLRPDGSGYAAN